MKLVFDVENKTVELINSKNEMIDAWKVENEKTFFFTRNSVVDYIAVYISYCETTNLYFCNGMRRLTGEEFTLCPDNEFLKFFIIESPIINDYKILMERLEADVQ